MADYILFHDSLNMGIKWKDLISRTLMKIYKSKMAGARRYQMANYIFIHNLLSLGIKFD